MNPNKKTVKQHYVPQFYLRQWTDRDGGFYPAKIETKNPPKIVIFNKKSGPASFCYENYFYAQHTGEEDEISQIIEKDFAEAEGVFSKILPEIEKRIVDSQQVTGQDKYTLSEFMLFLWFKGKQHRMQSQNMMEDLIKEMNKHMVQYIDNTPEKRADLKRFGLTKKDMVDFAEEGKYRVSVGNMRHMAIMKDLPKFCNLLSLKYWTVYICRNGHFLTTDAPGQDRALSSDFWGNDFMSREHFFVLSPRVVIVARNPNDLNSKNFIRKDLTHKQDKVHTLNGLILMNAIRFGFHPEKSVLEEAKKCAEILYLSHQDKSAE